MVPSTCADTWEPCHAWSCLMLGKRMCPPTSLSRSAGSAVPAPSDGTVASGSSWPLLPVSAQYSLPASLLAADSDAAMRPSRAFA